MKTRSTALGAALAVCALVGAPSVASAGPPTIAKLRVEARGGALDPGVHYVNNTARLATRRSECGGTGQTKIVRDPSAIGIVEYAKQTNRRLRPFFVSDQYDFGLIACRIGNAGAFDMNQAWLYKVDHKSALVGGDQYRLGHRDEVLWYFADWATGENTGDELGLRAPVRVTPGKPFKVVAIAYDAEGRERTVAGATVEGGDAPVVTGADGSARVTLARQGTKRLRVEHGNDIPSAPTAVCANRDLRRCPPRRPEFIVGTDRPEPIKATPAPDLVYARGGDDRIDVRRGGVDSVSCGPGTDAVLADPGDRVGSDCERLNGRTRR